MSIVIKSTLGCLIGATTSDPLVPGTTIHLTTADESRDIDIVYVRQYPDRVKVMNSNITLWLVNT